jgi:hypothetical protein
MVADLLESFKILTELVVQAVGDQLAVFTSLDVLLSVQEPLWNLEFQWVLEDGGDAFQFFSGEFTSSVQMKEGWLEGVGMGWLRGESTSW